VTTCIRKAFFTLQIAREWMMSGFVLCKARSRLVDARPAHWEDVRRTQPETAGITLTTFPCIFCVATQGQP
jgi:hypothetical protein